MRTVADHSDAALSSTWRPTSEAIHRSDLSALLVSGLVIARSGSALAGDRKVEAAWRLP
ncbi:unspecified product [Leishmania tarentolae]|uniref:Unspecified product n=1 Tax=Leishmania tarentolae TaxID=5689 RepID=A0A640KWC2_LEITA|nr:unspecified product [Leishmania tarentolae]